ncbi:unnamed protein product, partial [marine sediment metagenome]
GFGWGDTCWLGPIIYSLETTDMVFVGGMEIRVIAYPMDAGDQFSSGYLWVEEWIEE